MSSHSVKKVAATGLLLGGVIAAWVAWPRSSPPSEPPPPAPEETSTPAPATIPGAAAPQPLPPGAAEVLPIPGCWDGLLAFDRDVSLATFQQALAAAVAAKDRALATYLQERLTELVGDSPERALQVLAWAERASQPELGVYVEALKAAPAVHAPQVAERLLQLGEDGGAPLLNRSAALDALETQRRLPPAALARLKAVALDERVDSVAWVATRTLGRVMKEDFERTGTFAPYWGTLLDIGETSEDTAVRLLALEMPSYSDPLLSGDSLDRLATILRKDAERDVREMAAFRLAVTEEPQKALAIYREAFPAEQDLCVRWAILRFAVRAAGAQALPLLEAFAAQDPRFRQDVLDFKALYASGTVDFARIWLGKAEHHSCTIEDGAPHG